MTAPEQPAEVWRAALADGTGRHVPVRKHWPELAAALDAEVDAAGAVPDTGRPQEIHGVVVHDVPNLVASVMRISEELDIDMQDDGWADEIIRRAQRSAYSQGWHDATEQAREALNRRTAELRSLAAAADDLLGALDDEQDSEPSLEVDECRDELSRVLDAWRSGDTVQAPDVAEAPTLDRDGYDERFVLAAAEANRKGEEVGHLPAVTDELYAMVQRRDAEVTRLRALLGTDTPEAGS